MFRACSIYLYLRPALLVNPTSSCKCCQWRTLYECRRSLRASSAAATAAFAGASYGGGCGSAGSGASSDVAQIAQAAAMRGGEVGITAAAVAATGGGAGIGVAANDVISQELSGRGIVVPAPDSLGSPLQGGPSSPSVPSFWGDRPGSVNHLSGVNQTARNLHSALNRMPEGGSDMNGPAPRLGHDKC